MKPSLLVIDDDESIRNQLKWALADDYDVALAADRADAMARLVEKPRDAILLDLGLPPHANDATEGLLALVEIRQQDPDAKVIVISGQSEKEYAIRAISDGAYDFLCKPIQADELLGVLKRACYVRQLERTIHELQQVAPAEGFEGMLGGHAMMQTVFATIRKVAGTEAPVLILGESGTGKEMTALAIHRRSARTAGPFVAINCGAIPETLLESELFGHEKGAFTGAHTLRQGHIETANGGTLFLDEIGDLPAPLQVKLLRFLQERNVQRVGGRANIPVDVRVIAATNTDIQNALKTGAFREDLYYRLAVVTIQLPALRDRKGDITLLAKAFLQRFSAEAAGRKHRFSTAAIEAMEAHEWPGNIRELENKVRRAVIMAESKQLTPADLELDTLAGSRRIPKLKDARDAVERELVARVLELNHGQVAKSARDLGISRPTLYELMDRFDLRPDKDKDKSEDNGDG